MLEVVFEIIIPLCMARLIDRGIEQSNMSAVWIYGLGLLALALLQMGTGFLRRARRRKVLGGLCRQSARGYVQKRAGLLLFQH